MSFAGTSAERRSLTHSGHMRSPWVSRRQRIRPKLIPMKSERIQRDRKNASKRPSVLSGLTDEARLSRLEYLQDSRSWLDILVFPMNSTIWSLGPDSIYIEDGERLHHVFFYKTSLMRGNTFPPILKRGRSVPKIVAKSFALNRDEDLKTGLRCEKLSISDLKKKDRRVGEYYPGVYRPILRGRPLMDSVDAERENPCTNQEQSAGMRDASLSLGIISDDIKRIMQFVDFSEASLKATGPAIRNLLLIAAMEVEMHFKQILISNRYSGCERSSTRDYVKLAGPIFIREREVVFEPTRERFIPFKSWSSEKPTKSLEWYDRYNATKHDRFSSRAIADLRTGIEAAAAAVVASVCRFGFEVLRQSSARDLFDIDHDCWKWPHSSCYVQAHGLEWMPRHLQL